MNKSSNQFFGTIIWVAPFYNRSGYGVGARSFVSMLYKEGYRIRIVPVDEVEKGIDDFDLELFKKLEKTEIVPPITAIFSHVPLKAWVNFNLPEPNIRILETTFDSSAQGNLPPKKWLDICNSMDQIWLRTEDECKAFIAAGIPEEKVKFVRAPHHWSDNDSLPPVKPKEADKNGNFRFLSIAMFLPRRRWDVLIEAFLEEFKHTDKVELYLKVNYPSWHPIPDKPRKDLHNIIDKTRKKINSKAIITVDESLGTRQGIAELIDSCDVYVSTDTSFTAPVGEAWARQRTAVLPVGLTTVPEIYYFGIKVNPNAKMEMTKEMLEYQPHHSGSTMPQLLVEDVRDALSRAINLPVNEKQILALRSSECVLGKNEVLSEAVIALNDAWNYKKAILDKKEPNRKRIIWEGKIDSKSSLAKVNFEMLKELNPLVENLNILSDDNVNEFATLLIDKREYEAKNIDAGIHVRHEFPPNLNSPKSGRWVVIQPWEFGSLPKKWVNIFAKDVDEMWVPSNYVKQCYSDSGIPEDRVFVIPNGFNPSFYNKEKAEIKLQTKKKFKFLFVGGTIYRKGIDILLKAYTEQFSGNDDVCLVIKDMGGNSFYDGQTFVDEIKKIQKDKTAPEIEYIDKFLSEEELKGLYQSADVLVHPYRGEGFGLPILEAMACGTPVITTNGGAALDFCNSENSFLVDAEKTYYKEKKVGNLETVSHPWLFEVSSEKLKNKMQYVVANKNELSEKAKKAYQFVHSNFTWKESAKKIEERIEVLSMKSIRRYENKKAVKATIFTESITEAFEFIDKKEYKNALSKIERAIENYVDKNSSNIKLDELLIVKGNLHISTQNIKKAKEAFEAALNENPNSSAACQGLGDIFHSIEEYEAAKTMYEWAVKNDEKNEVAANKLRTLNKSLGLDEYDISLSEEV